MNKEEDRNFGALLKPSENGPWAEKRPTDIYYQNEPGEPFLFVSRCPGVEPLEAVQQLARERETTPRIVRNLWECDIWRFEGLARPYRIATVWRARTDTGEILPPKSALLLKSVGSKMTTIQSKIPSELYQELLDVFGPIPEGLDADEAAELVSDALFHEEDTIYDELCLIEGRAALEGESNEITKERENLTRRRNILRRALDYLDSTPWTISTEGLPIVFKGRLVAEASSRRGKIPRWVDFRLYRTEDGRYVCENVRVSTKSGEVDIAKTKIVDTDKEVAAFFKGSFAPIILDQAGIVAVEKI